MLYQHGDTNRQRGKLYRQVSQATDDKRIKLCKAIPRCSGINDVKRKTYWVMKSGKRLRDSEESSNVPCMKKS